MEGEILSALQFDLVFTSCLFYLDCWKDVSNIDKKVYNLTWFIIEKVQLYSQFSKFNKSTVTACALVIANYMWNGELTILSELLENFKCQIDEFKSCLQFICGLINDDKL